MLYKVPARFWDDHMDRKPCDGDADTELAREVSRAGSRVLIEGDASQIEWLRSDAAFYADKHGPDCLPAGLKASAVATLEALRKQSASAR